MFNVRIHLGACRTHDREKGGGGGGRGGSGTNKSSQKFDSRNRKAVFHRAPPRGSNPGSSDLNSDSLTVELCVLCILYLFQVKNKFPWEVRVAFSREAMY